MSLERRGGAGGADGGTAGEPAGGPAAGAAGGVVESAGRAPAGCGPWLRAEEGPGEAWGESRADDGLPLDFFG